MGRLTQYNGLEEAIFEDLKWTLRKGTKKSKRWVMTPKALTKDGKYELYAPSGVNYKVHVSKSKLGSIPARKFFEDGKWYQIGFGELRLKKPDKLAKDKVVYWNLPEIHDGGVFVAYENILGEGKNKRPVLRVDRLKNQHVESGPYEKIAQIDLSYYHDWREKKSDPFYTTKGALNGIQFERYSKDKAGLYHKRALENLIHAILLTDNLYCWSMPKKGGSSLPKTTYKKISKKDSLERLDLFF